MQFVFVHWFAYTVSMLSLFLCMESSNCSDTFICSVSSRSKSNKLFVAAALASAAGLPPFLGFWTKTALIIAAGSTTTFVAVVVMVVLLFIGLMFYLYLLRATMLAKTSKSSADRNIGLKTALLLINCAGFVFFDDILILITLLL